MAELIQKKMLQFLRGKVVASKEAAINGITGLTFPDGVNYDGTPIVARYADGDVVRSVFGIYHQGVSGQTGVTIFENANEVEAALDEFKSDTADALGIENVFSGGTKTPEQAVKEALSSTTYASASTSGETIVEAIEKLDAAIVANEIKSADKTVIVSKATSGTDISVNVDGLTIVKNITEGDDLGKISTAIEIKYVAAVPAAEGQAAVPAHIALVDNANTELSTVSVSDLIGNGQLTGSSYDKTTGILTLTFNMADGSTRDVEIDLKEMLDIDDVVIGTGSTNYLNVTLGASSETGENMVLDTKIVALSAVTSSANTGLLDAWDVKQNLTAADVELKALEAAVGGEYVPATEEAAAKFDTQLTGVTYAEPFASKKGVAAIESTDTLVEAVEKVESAVKVLVDEVLDNEEVAEKAVEALANAAGVLNAEGEISYTVHTSDSILSGASNLDTADVALADAIRDLEAEMESTKHTEVVAADADVISAVTEEVHEVESDPKSPVHDKVTLSLQFVDADTVETVNHASAAGLVKTVVGEGEAAVNKLDVSFDFGEVEF